jgi:hypothetical protein
MDIKVNEQPLVELGDLLFIDDMVRGQIHQVIYVSKIITGEGKDAKPEYHRYGLYNMKTHALGRTFRTDKELNQFVAQHLGAITIRKHADYIWSLQKK